ncbi:MAG: putative Ig domain-containing protein, partial [Pseudomonadota bacterium]
MGINDFTQYTLSNAEIVNPTSLQFGPDGRLYVSEQNGKIKAFTVQPTAGGGYEVTATEEITLVQEIPNHNDDGTYNPDETERQVTGILLTEDAAGNVVMYVGSSDPRIAVGNDSGLDTNSGMISRLTQQPDGSWDKVDLVRGLPRSEENHANNGMQLSPDGTKLYVASGGNTNKGAPGDKFAFTPEYYYSAAVLEIDLQGLAALEQSQGTLTYNPAPALLPDQKYLYDLPTLDDPTRANESPGVDVNDVFGGNDGLNQAKFDSTDRDGDGDPDPYVTVYSPGYRNIYDLLITQDGKFYTWDNGPNTGWGGEVTYADGTVVTDLDGDGLPDFYDGDGDGVADIPGNFPSELESDKYPDSLSFVDQDINDGVNPNIYGGHPNPIRAYGELAGLYDDDGNLLPLPADFDSVNGFDAFGNPIIDPRQAVYNAPDTDGDNNDQFDGSLYTINSSTNGLAEYTSTADPSLTGALLAVSFNGKITALPRNPDGTPDLSQDDDRAITNKPLDVIAQGDTDPFAGTIWVAGFGPNQIIVLDPAAGVGVTPNPFDRDEDGITDTIDPFVADPLNGTGSILNAGETWTLDFIEGASFPNDPGGLFDGTAGLYNGFDIGFTGIMTDGAGLPETLFDNENIIAGGAPNQFQIKDLNFSSGTASTDNQQYGFQFGMAPSSEVGSFVYSATMDNFFDELGAIDAGRDVVQGIVVGTGDQSDYFSVAYVRRDGVAGIEVVSETSDFFGPGTPQTTFYAVPQLTSIANEDTVELRITVDINTGTLTPGWTVTTGNKSGQVTEADFAGTVNSVTLSEGIPGFTGPDPLLQAVRGEYQLPSGSTTTDSGVALGVIASLEAGPGTAVLPVEWDKLDVTGIADPGISDTTGPNVTIKAFDPGAASDGPWTVEVIYSDNVALDFGTIQDVDLSVTIPNDGSGNNPVALIDDFDLTLSQNNKTAVATYQIISSTGLWNDGNYTFEVAANAVSDTFGNANALTQRIQAYTEGATNNAPVVDQGIANQSGTQNAPFSFTIPANAFSDPDGDDLDLSFAGPAWLSFDPVLNVLSGTPGAFDAGANLVTITATDREAVVNTNFTINVIDVNDAPIIDQGVADQAAPVGSAFSFTIPATAFSDPDTGDVLDFDVAGLPSWASFDPVTDTITGTPGAGDLGTTNVTVTADDGEFSVNDTFALSVVEPLPVGTVVAAINAGGPQRSIAGTVWEKDTKSSPYPLLTLASNNRTQGHNGTPIEEAGVLEDILIWERWSFGQMSYDVDVSLVGGVAGGLYEVQTYFVEHDLSNAVGDRVFDIEVEGEYITDNGVVVGDNYDILATVGAAKTAASITHVVDLADGDSIIDIDITPEGGSKATLAGILVRALGSGNVGPEVSGSVSAQVATEDSAFSFTLPAGLFSDADTPDLTLSAPGLPAWLS